MDCGFVHLSTSVPPGRADGRSSAHRGRSGICGNSYWRTLDPNAAALLVEFGAEDSNSP
jgi:hypothetical protein